MPEPCVWLRRIRILDDDWQEFDVFYATPYGDLERFTVVAWYNDELKSWECDEFTSTGRWGKPVRYDDECEEDVPNPIFLPMVTEQFDLMVDHAISAYEERISGGE